MAEGQCERVLVLNAEAGLQLQRDTREMRVSVIVLVFCIELVSAHWKAQLGSNAEPTFFLL